jgi:hypothetical protein
MPKDHQKNVLFVKALADEQPIEKRIELYRWLADLAGDEWLTHQILQQAANLENSKGIDAEIQLRFADAERGDGDGNGDGQSTNRRKA